MEKRILLVALMIVASLCAYSQKVKITHLANEGILISSEDASIAIDGVFGKEFDYLGVLSDSDQEKLLKATEPFGAIQFILATHFHGDHFSAELVREYLTNHLNTTFIGTSESTDKFNNSDKEHLGDRIKSISPELHHSELIELSDDNRVTAMRVRHLGQSPWKEAHNLAYLVEMSGKKIVHWGDGELTKDNLEALNLKEKAINVAVLPVFAISGQDQIALIEEHFPSTKIILTHIPVGTSLDQLKGLQEMFPNALIWDKQFEKLELE